MPSRGLRFSTHRRAPSVKVEMVVGAESAQIRHLDVVQLARIEATHSGFLYQHLFAVGHLLSQTEGVISLLVESDEDVEIVSNTTHHYAQVKFHADPLQPSDIRPILDRFSSLREEHRTDRRPGACSFSIVSRSEPSASLTQMMGESTWPADVDMVTPGSGRNVFGVPAWPTLPEAIEWAVNAARRVQFSKLEPETLVLKLAAQVQLVASGRFAQGSHEIRFSDLGQLREQLDLFAECIPPAPNPYRPLEHEPEIVSDKRIRLIIGVSGSGKSSWFSDASEHLPGTIVFARASRGIVDVSTWLVRHIAANMLRVGGAALSAVFRPGALGEESLSLLDRYGEQQAVTVVLDNVHLLDPAELTASIRSTNRMRWILLGQPGPAAGECAARLGIDVEELGGWDVFTIANVLGTVGVQTTPELTARLLRLTGGLPLFVESTARLVRAEYAGDLSRLLDEQAKGTHSASLQNETTLTLDVVRLLSESTRSIAATLSALRADVPTEVINIVAARAFAVDAIGVASALRELRTWRIVRPTPKGQIGIHDAFRPALDAARSSLDNATRERALQALVAALRALRAKGGASVDSFLDTLKLLGELREGVALIDVVYGSVEWIAEFGASREVALLLDDVLSAPELPTEFHFLGADAACFLAIQRRDLASSAAWLDVCERVASTRLVRPPEWEARLAIKRILRSHLTHDFRDARAAYSDYKQWAEPGTDGYRIVKYDFAVAAHSCGEFRQAIELTSELIEEYFDQLGLTPAMLLGKNPEELSAELSVRGNEDDFRQLADCFYLRTLAVADIGGLPGLDPFWAMKLFDLVGARSSAIRSGLEAARVCLRGGDVAGALGIFEKGLVQTIERERLMGWIVPVYMDYARVLAAAERFEDARKKLQAIEVFVPMLPEVDRRLFAQTVDSVTDAERQNDLSVPVGTTGVRQIDRQRFAAYPSSASNAPKVWNEVAWYEALDGSAIGLIAREFNQGDYGWVAFGDDGDIFRTRALETSYTSAQAAISDLMAAMADCAVASVPQDDRVAGASDGSIEPGE